MNLFNFKKHGMKKSYVMGTLAILTLGGCSNDIKESDVIFAGEAGAKVSFSAVINNQETNELVTRATETNWEIGDTVGITCGTEQVNIKYEYTGGDNSIFTAKGGYGEAIWVLGTQEYDVTAYYPFVGNTGEVPTAIEVSTGSENQATARKREQIDFLYASGRATAATPNVKLAFNHVMSRIKLTFTAGSNVTLSDITCYLINLKTSGTFNPNTGVTSVNASATAQDIIWEKIGNEDNYTVQAILLPQTVGNEVYIQAGMNGYYYEVHFPNLAELKPGVSYNYTIQANEYKDNPFVLIITEETQIIGWQNEDGGTIESDPSVAGTDAEANNPEWDITEEKVISTPVSN